MNRSQITVDLTDATDSFTVEAIIYNGGRSIRRFQTIPVVKKENRYDVFFIFSERNSDKWRSGLIAKTR